MKKEILIAGGSGLLGSSLLDHLINLNMIYSVQFIKKIILKKLNL